MKTISDLRKRCKASGITLKVETLSWGKHATFKIDGASTSSVLPKALYDKNREAFDELQRIKEEFRGDMDVKLYGLG